MMKLDEKRGQIQAKTKFFVKKEGKNKFFLQRRAKCLKKIRASY